MRGRFRSKLFTVMALFAFSITVMISIIDYNRMKSTTVHQNKQLMHYIEKNVQQTLEKVYYYFDDETTDKMRAATMKLLDKYEENPDFSTWNFTSLKNELKMDIYIINQDNEIIFSSYPADLGLDFDKCCTKIAPIIQERREKGGFFHDGIDLDQKTGKVRKYSYTATRDHHYIIQLGTMLENDMAFQQFNFLQTNHELVREYDVIDDINILNIAAQPFGKPGNRWLIGERKEAFNQVLSTGETIEVKQLEDHKHVVYRYIPYHSLYDDGTTKEKIIEIAYNDHLIQQTLDLLKRKFFIQFFIILSITLFLSFLIAKWVSRPMYLAFHDHLTGLKNRAAFEDFMTGNRKSKENVSLLMIDLDNFKQVNDDLGHAIGDKLLQNVAETMKNIIAAKGDVFRFGGDEFVVIVNDTKRSTIEDIANKLIHRIQDSIARTHVEAQEKVSASIGVAIKSFDGENVQSLYKKADIALYHSKRRGKAQFQIFNETL